jgi:hypothetical protein
MFEFNIGVAGIVHYGYFGKKIGDVGYCVCGDFWHR